MNLTVLGGISKSLFTRKATIPNAKKSSVGLVRLERRREKSIGGQGRWACVMVNGLLSRTAFGTVTVLPAFVRMCAKK